MKWAVRLLFCNIVVLEVFGFMLKVTLVYFVLLVQIRFFLSFFPSFSLALDGKFKEALDKRRVCLLLSSLKIHG